MGKDEYSPNILIIDDERDIREGCERILKKMGNRIFSADYGEAGLAILDKETIHIVICDIKMPGIDGIEVLDRIKQAYESVLVIMITGFGTVEIAITAMKKGAYDFIAKPFTPDQLRIVVRRAVEKLRLEAQARILKREHRQNLADLDAEKSRIRTIIESLPNGVLVTNMSGRIVLTNPMAKAILDLPEDMKSGQTIAVCIKDEGLSDYLLTVSRCSIKGKSQIEPYELALPEERYVRVQGRPVVGEDGDCLGAVVELSDISDLKLFDRLRSEFVAKVSHELRSPLSVIHEQLAMVLRAKEGTGVDDQYILGRAKEKTHTLISLIGDLLDISKIEAGTGGRGERPLVNVQVVELVQGVVDFLDADIKKKGHQLSYKTPDIDIPTVIADPIALESVFGNLITNAVKYTPDNGKVWICIDLVGHMVRVRIKDNGFGMEEHHLKKIFEKFYRIKDEKTRYINGTGLGLPIAKAMVDALGGQILVTSTPGKGSEFTVLLPTTQ